MSEKNKTFASKLKFYAEGKSGQIGQHYQIYHFLGADGADKEIIIPSDDIAVSETAIFKRLVKEGVKIPLPQAQKKQLLNDLQMQRDKNKREVEVAESLGWTDDTLQCFMLPETTYQSGETEVLFYDRYRQANLYESSGTLSQWKQQVVSLCTGNNNLMFSLALAFAPPLMRLLDIESSGFQFCGKSSIGKTKSLMVARSVWGKSQLSTWNTTINATDRKGLTHNDVLLCIDETELAEDNTVVLKAVYRLAAGIGKDRLPEDQPQTWSFLFLSSSEYSLRQIAERAGETLSTGQSVRFTDIAADAGKGLGSFDDIHGYANPGKFADALGSFCKEYYGVASKAFLKKLVANIAEDEEGLKTWLKEKMAYYIEHAAVSGHDGVAGRIGNRVALVYAAGRLACKYKILPWSYEALFNAVHSCHQRMIELAEKQEAAATKVKTRYLQHVRQYIKTNKSQFIDLRSGKRKLSKKELHGASGVIYRNKEGDIEYLFPYNQFRQSVCGTANPVDSVIRLLRKRDFLSVPKNANENTTQRPLLASGGTSRVIAVKASIMKTGQSKSSSI